MNRPAIFTLSGLPRHGKTTMAGYLAQLTGLHYADCSSIIYQHLAERRGCHVESLRSVDKAALRTDLINLGDELCKENPAFLSVSLVEKGVKIISGVRRPAELVGLMGWAEANGFQVIPIWVEAMDEAAKLRYVGASGFNDNRDLLHCAATIVDNTDVEGLRPLCRHIVPNLTEKHLWSTARFICAMHPNVV